MNVMESVIVDRTVFDVINGELIIDNKTPIMLYGTEYLDNYRMLAETAFSVRLSQWRRAYAESWSKGNENKFLDFGCGFSPIIAQISVRDWLEWTGTWYGTDINEESGTLPHMKDRWVPPQEVNLKQYDVVCFFDVLEHLRNYKEVLKKIKVGNAIVVTVPCWNEWDKLGNITAWRHYKPSEHVLYGSANGWIREIEKCGFKLLDHSTQETAMGRLDSHTFAFRRVR